MSPAGSADSGRPSRLRALFGPLALLTLGLGVGLVAAEAMIRVTNQGRYGERPVFYPKDDTLGWVPAPGLDHTFYGGDFAIHVATDDFGNRLGELGPVPADAEQVVLLGDSYTFSWGVSTAESYPSQLDTLIAKRGTRAVNLGVSGYGTTQSVARLERYLSRRPDVRLHAIVLLHSHNDPSDNVRHAAARRGLRAYTQERRNTGLHLHNLVRFVQNAVRSREDSAPTMLPGGHRDFLFTVASEPTEAGEGAATMADPAPGSDAELMAAEQEVVGTYQRGSLTRLQLELLERSIERLAEIGAERGAPVVHAAIHSAPEWYLAPIREMVRASAVGRPGVSWCGAIPATEEFTGTFLNDHSGSHFTPDLNGFYAARIAEWLAAGGCS